MDFLPKIKVHNPYTQSSGPPKMLKSFVCFADILGYTYQSKEAILAGKGEIFLRRLHKALSVAYARVRERSTRGYRGEAIYDIKVFTDNIVVGFPIDDFRMNKGEPELGTIMGLFAEFQAGLAMEGFLLRGGIAYGDHYMDENIVFGGALLEAIGLDKGGGPPRISLAPSAVRLVQKHFGFYYNPNHAPHYENLLEDADGVIFLNYLEHAFFAFPEGGVFFDVIGGHQQSVIKGLEKYRGEPGIRAKYEWAARYHNFVCREFANRHPIPYDPDADEVYALAAEEAQQLFNYLVDVESLAAEPHRILINPIQPPGL
jgi:hypothetical protein